MTHYIAQHFIYIVVYHRRADAFFLLSCAVSTVRIHCHQLPASHFTRRKTNTIESEGQWQSNPTFPKVCKKSSWKRTQFQFVLKVDSFSHHSTSVVQYSVLC